MKRWIFLFFGIVLGGVLVVIPGSFAAPGSGKTPTETREKWEYASMVFMRSSTPKGKKVLSGWRRDTDPDTTRRFAGPVAPGYVLNEMGAQGWELVATEYNGNILIFKRRKL